MFGLAPHMMVPMVKRVSDSRTTGFRPNAPDSAENTGWKAAEQRTNDVYELSVSLHEVVEKLCVEINDAAILSQVEVLWMPLRQRKSVRRPQSGKLHEEVNAEGLRTPAQYASVLLAWKSRAIVLNLSVSVLAIRKHEVTERLGKPKTLLEEPLKGR